MGDTWDQLSSGFTNADAAYNVQALAHDPSGWLYAGTLDGLYVSKNGGQMWQFVPPSDDQPDEARRILSLTVVTDTSNYSGTLLIGTQGAGLHALDIEGQSWFTPTIDKSAHTIQVLLSTQGGVAYAGTVDSGIFETEDGGRTWQPRIEGLPLDSLSILSLAKDPADGTLYAGTYGDSVYRLRAGSERWVQANAGLPPAFPIQKMAFAGPTGERHLVAAQVGGLYVSKSRHEPVPMWDRLPQALPIGPARDVAGMAVSGPDYETVVVAAGTGVIRSTDAGNSWTGVITSGLPAYSVRSRALVQGRQNPRIHYVAFQGEGSIYRSEDAGANWESIPGKSNETMSSQLCCLVIGADDSTLYLVPQPSLGPDGISTQRIYVTHDGGINWSSLPAIGELGAQEILELDWSQRSLWDVFVYGGHREMLYARTTDGIYVSYDKGVSWRLSLRGSFSTMLADPYHPWLVLTVSQGDIVEPEGTPPIELPPELWVSRDGGETWRRAGFVPQLPAEFSTALVTTLAVDPQADLLYVGTDGFGVYSTDLPKAARPFNPVFIATSGLLLLVAVLVLLGLVYIVYSALGLGRQFRPSFYRWPGLAYLRLRHNKQVELVTSPYIPLTSLERLVLAYISDQASHSAATWQQLTTNRIPATFAQTEQVLDTLLKHDLLCCSEGQYEVKYTLLGQIARKRFWSIAVEREELIKDVHRQVYADHLANARRFFERAGFETFPLDPRGFMVTSEQPQYALLGADQNIYVHLQTTATVKTDHLEELEGIVYGAYGEQLTGRIAFLVVREQPKTAAYRRIIQLWHRKELRLVLLSYDNLCQAADATTSRQVLNRSLQRALGNANLFRLEEPISNWLDFFGREAELQDLEVACQTGQVIGLAGMIKVGKTSLVQKVMDRLPDAIIAWVDLDTPPTSGLYSALRKGWLTSAKIRYRTWSPPDLGSPLAEASAAQIKEDCAAICRSLPDQAHLVAVFDGLISSQFESREIENLAQAIAATEGASLLAIFEVWPQNGGSFQMIRLRPFKPGESTELIDTLAIQMGLEFELAAKDELQRASGGHPLILRQLASLVVTHRASDDPIISVTDVEKGIAKYIADPNASIREIWDRLSEDEQRALWSAIKGQATPTEDVLEKLSELGWLIPAEDRWGLFSEAMARWLKSQVSSLA